MNHSTRWTGQAVAPPRHSNGRNPLSIKRWHNMRSPCLRGYFDAGASITMAHSSTSHKIAFSLWRSARKCGRRWGDAGAGFCGTLRRRLDRRCPGFIASGVSQHSAEANRPPRRRPREAMIGPKCWIGTCAIQEIELPAMSCAFEGKRLRSGLTLGQLGLHESAAALRLLRLDQVSLGIDRHPRQLRTPPTISRCKRLPASCWSSLALRPVGEVCCLYAMTALMLTIIVVSDMMEVA